VSVIKRNASAGEKQSALIISNDTRMRNSGQVVAASPWPLMSCGTFCGTPSDMWSLAYSGDTTASGQARLADLHVTSGERPRRVSGDARLLETEGDTFFAPLLPCLPDRLGGLN
jgi:hypothetical protein